MQILHIAIFGFIFLWYEVAAYFHMDVNTAFLMTVVVFAWHYVIHQWCGELLGQSQALTAAFFEHGVSWVALLFWLWPAFCADLPFTVNVAGWAGLALVGAHARRAFDQRGLVFDKLLFRQHTDAVVGAMIAFWLPNLCLQPTGDPIYIVVCAFWRRSNCWARYYAF